MALARAERVSGPCAYGYGCKNDGLQKKEARSGAIVQLSWRRAAAVLIKKILFMHHREERVENFEIIGNDGIEYWWGR